MSSEANRPQGELERTLGLRASAAIAMGTMVGAGIFVFPGMAAGRAGMAAMLSFAIGALVSLPVALCASELATAMPRSGGGYFFVSRGFGGWLGAVVGIALWWGLVFASAFYLVGFAHYLADLITRLGFEPPNLVQVTAIVTATGLTVINVLGTRKSGKLQNVIVSALMVLLVAFLGYGAIETTAASEQFAGSESFAPYGALPILTTTSLVFTSYLGFAQVAGVAGEIRRPSRNLPLAMIGSVVLIGLLYVTTIFVATQVFTPEQLASMGETAMIEVGRELLGSPGAIAIVVAGLLATISSANASLLSSSRTVYALGRDRLLPQKASTVSDRFGTPHVSIIGAGVPIAGLTLFGQLETLAEVASFLHLLMYALICAVVLRLRHESPDWYAPSFRVPASPVVPLIGIVASLGVIAFMNFISILIGVAICGAAVAWYFAYASDVSLQGAFNE